MNNLVQSHLSRHPKARPTTISDKLKIQATCEQLRSEIAKAHADKAVNEFRDEEAWKKGPNALMLIAGRLKILAARLVQ